MLVQLTCFRQPLTPLFVAAVLLLMSMVGAAVALAQEPAKTSIKSESFDRDPGWEAHNNRIVPDEYPTIVQDFGYSETNVAGKSPGEMGGRVSRASEPAFYAARL
ncbi:MAG: hypothetical protein KY475_23760, partial [Planctomycetes bacterium]|nr:hypothetical protein [Planctomycetota bacterium]